MKKILISPNAFKGTLSPSRAARLMAAPFQKNPEKFQVTILPLADGGDGTLDVLMSVFGGKIQKTRVRGPLGQSVTAQWGITKNKTAVIEMARASGLALVNGKNRILEATSFGTGQLIKAALDKGCKTIYIGVGGTATADGGAGALKALGLRYFGKNGESLSSAPKDLIHLTQVDWHLFDKRVYKAKIKILCDVDNPLLGTRGSARTFGPQKGARPRDVQFLEDLMKKWAGFALRQTKNKPGSGAAGALAFGLSAFAGAQLTRGAEAIMEILNWKQQARKADIILTGEGKLDKTSFAGKVVGNVSRCRGKAFLAVICGSHSLSRRFLQGKGIGWVQTLGPAGLKTPTRALKAAAQKIAQKI